MRALGSRAQSGAFNSRRMEELLRIQIQQGMIRIGTSIMGAVGGALGRTGPVDAAGNPSAYNQIDYQSAPVGHGGGVPGVDSLPRRLVPASTFAHAPRLHGGIGPGERPAVIRRDEGVFTAGQMRALGLRAQAGGLNSRRMEELLERIAAKETSPTVIVVRSEEEVYQALGSRRGREIQLETVQRYGGA